MNKDEYNRKLYELITNKASAPYLTPKVFYDNYKDMQQNPYDGADKYFHAKANCQAGQYGDILNALGLSTLKEFKDIAEKNGYNPNGKPLKYNLQDSWKDLQADCYGLFKGATNPLKDCRTLLNKYRLPQIDEQY